MQCSLITWVQAACLCLWEQCRAIGSALFSIFERSVPDLSPKSSLADRTITLGGIENAGNSCIFAAMLQDFAALPQVYDPLFSCSLSKGSDEPDAHFTARQALQRCLRHSIEKIRSGNLVETTEIRALAEQLQQLGWQGHLSSAWSCFLHRLAPEQFPLPHFSVYDLYERTLSCFLGQDASTSIKIVLTGKEHAGSFSEFFASHAELGKVDSSALWRVALKNPPAALEEQVQVGSREFSLRVVHAFRTTPLGKHVVVYRKVDDEWICCDDTKITRTAPQVQDHVYMVVYENSRAS